MTTLNCANSADECRRRGWAVGTMLTGKEGRRSTVIMITAVGESHVLAKVVPGGSETSWTLACRDWREVRP